MGIEIKDLTVSQARKLAKQHGVTLPRPGWEKKLKDGSWLASTAHPQFGRFGQSETRAPFWHKIPFKDPIDDWGRNPRRKKRYRVRNNSKRYGKRKTGSRRRKYGKRRR